MPASTLANHIGAASVGSAMRKAQAAQTNAHLVNLRMQHEAYYDAANPYFDPALYQNAAPKPRKRDPGPKPEEPTLPPEWLVAIVTTLAGTVFDSLAARWIDRHSDRLQQYFQELERWQKLHDEWAEEFQTCHL